VTPADTTLPGDDPAGPNRYFDPHLGREAAKILPGEYFVSSRDLVLVTVLGSCVAACLRDPRTGIGGMNHFMLPEGHGGDLLGAPARYGVHAMELLLNELMKRGARRDALEAKVFGGGNVLAQLATANVGERNAAFVLRYLSQERIRVAAQDLGDVHARKIYYSPRDGRVRVKRLRSLHNDTLLRRETDYRNRLAHAPVTGDVELFG
jgi:chemotaxis protein CheD